MEWMPTESETARIIGGDCLDVLRQMPDGCVDSVVTDPPYGLAFMGKKWDYDVPGVEVWSECLRVLKPGGHLLCFAGTRTHHRMCCRIEDAGFEIRDMIAWVYGSGFPKSLDVSKAIDKQRTEDIQPAADVAKWLCDRMAEKRVTRRDLCEHFNAENIAQQWTTHWTDGAVKPRVPKWEQWLALKELLQFGDEMDAEVWRLNGRKGQPGEAWQSAEVVAVDVRMNEASGIVSAGRDQRVEVERQIKAANSDAARQWSGWGTALKPALEPITVARKPLIGTVVENVLQHGTGAINVDACRVGDEVLPAMTAGQAKIGTFERGVMVTPERVGRWPANMIHDGSDEVTELLGTAQRFFYCAKSSKCDRGEGNNHPTVKPSNLMRYLVRLVTPPGGTVLDPFAGSGSTGVAALLEGLKCILIEKAPEYLKICQKRVEDARSGGETCL